ncbi:MAG TPA: DUF4112 domain-containing protein [Longimicrobiaceae bacterium]|nr:DUF4112 domain-containing protein [Longimicrobiaceae bacterium]
MERTNQTRRARDFARILDSAFRVPGTRFRFGFDPILGLVPGVGDAIGGGFGFYLLYLAVRAGAPPVVLARMFLNIAADVLLGTVPLLGDLLDAGFKANLRNLALLERYLARPEETKKRSVILIVVLFLLLLALVIGAIWVVVSVIGVILGWIF